MAINERATHEDDSEEEDDEESSGDESYDYGFAGGMFDFEMQPLSERNMHLSCCCTLRPCLTAERWRRKVWSQVVDR